MIEPTLKDLVERVKRLTMERDELKAQSRELVAEMEVLVQRAKELQRRIDVAPDSGGGG